MTTHRGHGHCVAKGADVKRMMAEIYGKKEGLCQVQGSRMARRSSSTVRQILITGQRRRQRGASFQ